MKLLLLFFAIVSVIETASAQTPVVQVVSSRTDYTELVGDQVITRAYKGAYKLTHFRQEDDDYWHSFVIQGLTDTKRFKGISINPYLRCSSSRNFTKLMFKII